MIADQCIIIGGGSSIQEGLTLGLKDKLKNKFLIGCNFAFHYFEPTFTLFADRKVWTGNLLGISNPYIDYKHLELIQKQPLLITVDSAKIKPCPSNMIILKRGNSYQREKSGQNGFYLGALTGILAVGLASYLMNYNGEIFLCGFDWSKRTTDGTEPKTHYYPKSEINHKGQGLTNYYNKHNPNDIFKIYLQKHPKIYNVSLNSNITCFEKINYEQMFNKMNETTYDQNLLRKSIREIL
jgi:hypothetical protein